MHLRLSKRWLRRVGFEVMGLALMFGLTLGVFALGHAVTPRTSTGRPILYSPVVRAAEAYRMRAAQWLKDFEQLDQMLKRLSETDVDVYEQSTLANAALDQAVRLTQDIELTSAPAALADLRQATTDLSLKYLAAARAVTTAIGSPTPAVLAAAAQALDEARAALSLVKHSRWLTADQARD